MLQLNAKQPQLSFMATNIKQPLSPAFVFKKHAFTCTCTHTNALVWNPNNAASFVYCQREFHVFFKWIFFSASKTCPLDIHLFPFLHHHWQITTKTATQFMTSICFVYRMVCTLCVSVERCVLAAVKKQKPQQVSRVKRFHFCFPIFGVTECVRVEIHVCGFYIVECRRIFERVSL